MTRTDLAFLQDPELDPVNGTVEWPARERCAEQADGHTYLLSTQSCLEFLGVHASTETNAQRSVRMHMHHGSNKAAYGPMALQVSGNPADVLQAWSDFSQDMH